MPHVASVFSELMKPLDRRILNRIVASHDGDRGVGSGANAWTCVRHFRAMLFAQLAGLNSLREIVHGLAADPGGLYHLDLRTPCRSTLGDAQTKRPAAVFRDICGVLINQAGRTVRRESKELIQLIDASPIPLRDPRLDWVEADARTRGLKLHVGYDPRGDVIDHVELTSPKVSDITAARGLPIRPGAVYVFDKGYLDFTWWCLIHDADAVFVTRLKSNTTRRDVKPRPVEGDGILEDNDFKVGSKKPRGGAINPLLDTQLREILVERQDKAPMRLVTNDLTRSAAEIAALYKERWQIELLFKWIKQNLRIKRFLGRSENAVKIQIYVALIAFLLLRMLQHTHAAGHSLKALIAQIRVAMFQRLDLSGRSKPPPTNPAKLPPNPQFALAL